MKTKELVAQIERELTEKFSPMVVRISDMSLKKYGGASTPIGILPLERGRTKYGYGYIISLFDENGFCIENHFTGFCQKSERKELLRETADKIIKIS